MDRLYKNFLELFFRRVARWRGERKKTRKPAEEEGEAD
jgi:hypothetical protein